MPSVLDVYSVYMQAADLRGQARVLTVAVAAAEEIWNPSAKKAQTFVVLRFEKARKVMKLNKTQAAAMIEITGSDDYSTWPGARVLLSPAKATNGKDTIIITAAPVPVTLQTPATREAS